MDKEPLQELKKIKLKKIMKQKEGITDIIKLRE